jgi:hypothetical protein
MLITTLPHLEPTAMVDAYDGRATIEAAFCQDKQGMCGQLDGGYCRRQREGYAFRDDV